MISFVYPALFLLALMLMIILPLRRLRQPTVPHSRVRLHANIARPMWAALAAFMLGTTWLLMVACLAWPRVPQISEEHRFETRDICIAVDVSSSMWDPADSSQAPNYYPWGFPPGIGPQPRQFVKLIDVAQESIKDFIEKRTEDRLALFVFDGSTRLFCPLTKDHKMLKKQVLLINRKPGGSTNFDGPSRYFEGLGPIQATIDHLDNYGQAKTKIFIMVTDGVSNIDPDRFDQLAEAMEAQHIKIYVVGVGSGWTGGAPTDLQRFVDRLGGTVIRAGDGEAMRRAVERINQMEKSQVVEERPSKHKDIYQYIALLAGAAVLAYVFSSYVLRQNP